jgi:hypothetical protein
MTVRMATGGVRAFGHEFHADGLRFSGGQPSGWCIELEDANECSLREISAGPGGGRDDLFANGIRLYGTEAGKGVNYGDSLLEEISVKLKGANTTGVLIEHLGSAHNNKLYVMNNLLLNRVQVNSAGAPEGSVGIWLKRVMRSVLVNVDVEYLATAFKVEGAAGGGNAGSCRHVSFMNCYVLNCATPWVDSNTALAGSVMRCFFSNCNGFGLVNPVGVASDDAAARAGEGDTFLPGALWLNEPSNGQPPSCSGRPTRASSWSPATSTTGPARSATATRRTGRRARRSASTSRASTSPSSTGRAASRAPTCPASCWATARPSSPTA